MGKAEREQAKTMATQNNQRAIDQGSQTQTQLQGQLSGAETQAHDLSNAASTAYQGYTGGTGSYTPEGYSQVQNQNQKNIGTGGYDPTQLAKTRSDITGLQSQYADLTKGGMGGIDPAQASQIRGGYTNLINNGGLSDEAAGAMRRQAAGSTQSVYSTLGQNLTRKNAATGFGGAGGETAELARQAGQSAATATTGANAEIGKLQQSGKIAGVGGLSEFEQGTAAGQRAGLSGATSVTQTGANLEGNVAQNTLQASKASQDVETGVASQRMQAAGGIVNLYQADPGYVKTLISGILQSQQTTGQLTSQQASIMAELSKQPGLFQTIMGDVTAMGGAAAGVLSGVGALSHTGGSPYGINMTGVH